MQREYVRHQTSSAILADCFFQWATLRRIVQPEAALEHVETVGRFRDLRSLFLEAHAHNNAARKAISPRTVISPRILLILLAVTASKVS